jgi:hypothetical protein
VAAEHRHPPLALPARPPAADIAAKATDMAWTRDGRLVVLTGTAALGQVVAVWRPGQPRLALRQITLPTPSAGTDTLAIW